MKVNNKAIGIVALILVALASAVFAINSVQVGNINLTVWDSAEYATMYETNRTIFYANYTNKTAGTAITGAKCRINITNVIKNLTYNATSKLYEYGLFVPVGNHTYNVSCNKTGYPHLNVTNNITIPNRNPQLLQPIPNQVIEEDTIVSINLSNYFYEPDYYSQSIGWNYTAVENVTITLNNNTGMMNITPDSDFYGVRDVTITAVDPLNATNSSNLIVINVTNTPEINLSSPVNGSSGFYANTSITFKVTVADDYGIDNCSLFINGSLNQTNTDISVGSGGEAKNDSGTGSANPNVISTRLVKYLNLTDSNYNGFKAYMTRSSGATGEVIIKINGYNLFNISTSEVPTTPTNSWIIKPITNNSILFVGENNITFEHPDYLGANYFVLFDDGSGKYLVRFTNDLVEFDPLNLTKGEWNWTASCTNNQSQSKQAETWELTVSNSAPTIPTNIEPSNGSFSEEINISCAGSIDIDNDDIFYTLEYEKESNPGSSYTIISNDASGNYTWNISNISADNIRLRCSASDLSSSSQEYLQSGYQITINHPGAPTTPTAVYCNGGSCTGEFDKEVNVSCYGSNDTDSPFDYVIEAYYENANGTDWKEIAVVASSSQTLGWGNYSWNTTLLVSQEDVKVRCYAKDANNAPSSSLESSEFNITHLGAPTIPNLEPQSGVFGDEINITCNGSTGTGTIVYIVYANYDNEWHTINSSLGESDVFSWNISSISEQIMTLKCSAYNGTYYSQFNVSGNIRIDRSPTNPTNLEPTAGVYEYILNYSCSGSNNSNYFTYYIDAYYYNRTGTAWRSLTDSFPGIPPVNDSELAFEDNNNYILVNQVAGGNNFREFTINVTNGNYSLCINGYGTGAGPRHKIYWDCNSTFSDCEFNDDILFNSAPQTQCINITLTRSGLKYLQIKITGDASQSTISTYIDHAYLIAKPFEWNVASIAPQAGVDLRCVASDSRGNSSTFNPSGDFAIDRLPVFNNLTSRTIAYGSSKSYNLSKWFTDPDDDTLTFTSTSSTHASASVSGSNLTISVGGAKCSSGTVVESITITANDSIATTSQLISITITGCPTSTRGGGTTVVEVLPEVPVMPVIPIPETEPEPEPVIEEPKPVPFEKPVRKSQITAPVLQKIFDTKVRHTRDFFVSGDRTRIIEKIKNVGLYGLQDTIIKITIPKSIALSASEIEFIDQFTIIENDPVIAHLIPSMAMDEEIELSYALNRRLTKQETEIIIVEIIPRNLTDEEIDEIEKEIQQKVENTSKYISIEKEFVTDTEKQQTDFRIDLGVERDTILYNVSIFAEIPKCLVEILKEGMIESDIEFEIIAEDPLIRWHFDKLAEKEEINYRINAAADDNCTNAMNVMPLAHSILLLTAKANPVKAAIPLIIIPFIVLIITFFSAFGFEEKEKMVELSHLIKWARQMHRRGYSWQGIAESLKKTRRYSEGKIRQVIKFSMDLPRLIITKMDIGIEEGIVIVLILLNIFDFLKLLPGEVEFAKMIISWTALGFLLYHASITNILFGFRSRKIDLMLLAGYFMLIMKNLVEIAEVNFLEAGGIKDLYIIIANNTYAFETTMFIGGLAILAISAVFISRKRIEEKSFIGAIGEFGEPNSILKIITRPFIVFLTLTFFFVVVFNLMMEWLAIAVDSAILTAAVFFYLFVLVKHKEKHWIIKGIYKIGNVGEKFYEKFVELFHNRKTIFIGITGMLILHTITEIGIFMVPYVFGIYNPLYFATWQENHAPIFNIFGWIRSSLGFGPAGGISLFAQGIEGMGFGFSSILFAVYLLNIIAFIFLLTTHARVWYHIYFHRKKPASEVPSLVFSRFAVALFASSFTAFMLAMSFMIKGLRLRGLIGVDIITQSISNNPNLGMILAISILAGILVFMLAYVSKALWKAFNWITIVTSFGFFFVYIYLFFKSIINYYIVSINLLSSSNLLISAALLLFMTITILFYVVAVGSLLFELWLRNELGLRRILPFKELPESMKHFDMEYIHHESKHVEKHHGKKFQMLKEYILKEMRRGHSFSSVLLHIINVGWSLETVEDALRELEKNKEFIQFSEMMGHKHRMQTDQLAEYIERERIRKIPFHKTLKLIRKHGWTDADLIDALVLIKS